VYDPILYVPNAFFPDGINKVFKPVISLFDPANFSFSIYDRLGRILFETNDPQQGWTGEITLSGERAGPGVYQYLITMQDGQGILMTRRGHVTLID
jgi:gliding motility-associated-like protein